MADSPCAAVSSKPGSQADCSELEQYLDSNIIMYARYGTTTVAEICLEVTIAILLLAKQNEVDTQPFLRLEREHIASSA